MTAEQPTRIEKDSMGPMEVPADAYYGASTMRAVLNFPISDLRFPRSFIRALGLIKLTAAEVNSSLGLLEPDKKDAIVQAAQEVVDGKLDDHFVLDVFQTGSGTSTNMNANEVIANRASEIMGGDIGSRIVHPNDHVNKGQSSNDVIPTTMHLAALTEIETNLIPALQRTQAALESKSREFWDIIKTGRTHLQDATPVRLGQEFLGYAGQIKLGIRRLSHAREELSQVALGGTAVGTGVNTHPEFAARVTAPRFGARRCGNSRNREPFPGPKHPRRRRRIKRRPPDHRHQPHQDSQRHPLDGFRPEGRHRRACPPRSPARKLHNARQGQPGHSGIRHPGLRPGQGQRYGHRRCGPGQLLRNQPDDARGRIQSPAVNLHTRRRRGQLHQPVHRGSPGHRPGPERPWSEAL